MKLPVAAFLMAWHALAAAVHVDTADETAANAWQNLAEAVAGTYSRGVPPIAEAELAFTP